MKRTDAEDGYEHLTDKKSDRRRRKGGEEPAAPAKDSPPGLEDPKKPKKPKGGAKGDNRDSGKGQGDGIPPQADRPPPKTDPFAKDRKGKGVRPDDQLAKICYFFNHGNCRFATEKCSKDHVLVTKEELPLLKVPMRTGRSPSPKPKLTKGKVIEKGSIDDPAKRGDKIAWVIWDNSKRPEGKKRVPDFCGTYMKTQKCEWRDQNKCDRPHIDKDEKTRRQKALDDCKQ